MKPLRIQALPDGEAVKLEDVGGPGTYALEVEVEGHPFNARTALDAQGAATLAAGALHWLDVHAHEELEKLLAAITASSFDGIRDALAAAGFRTDAPVAGQITALAEERDRLAAALIGTQTELVAIRDAVVTDNSGDDDGWPTSLDAVKAVLESWSIALKDSQEESSKLATQRDSARAGRDKALVELDRVVKDRDILFADCNTAIAEMHEAKRQSLAYLRMVGELVGAITRPEVTRG